MAKSLTLPNPSAAVVRKTGLFDFQVNGFGGIDFQSDELTAGFIPDGLHFPPFVLRIFFRAQPGGRVPPTTAAMAEVGARPGVYILGKMPVTSGAAGIAHQSGGDGFAGSTLSPDTGVEHVARWLDPFLAAARRLWSNAPAQAFGVTLTAVPLL